MKPEEPAPEEVAKYEAEPERAMNRAERRRAQKAIKTGVRIPDELDIRKRGWDRRVLDIIDKVYINDICYGPCVAYSKLYAWAEYKGITMRMHGKVSITTKLDAVVIGGPNVS